MRTFWKLEKQGNVFQPEKVVWRSFRRFLLEAGPRRLLGAEPNVRHVEMPVAVIFAGIYAGIYAGDRCDVVDFLARRPRLYRERNPPCIEVLTFVRTRFPKE